MKLPTTCCARRCRGISDLIRDTGFINLDFADVTAVMKDAGLAHMGGAVPPARARPRRPPAWPSSSPLLETSINGAKGVLINVTGSMDIGLEEVEQAATLVQQAVHPDALTIFGATFDEELDDEILSPSSPPASRAMTSRKPLLPPPLPIRSSPRRMMPLPPPPPPSLWTRPRARRQRRAMWIAPSTRF